MTIPGTIYGVILNDKAEREALAASFSEKPYAAPPVAPVVYIKPRMSVTSGAALVAAGTSEVVAASTLALLFGRDASQVSADKALSHVAAIALALDVSQPQVSYYRPAIAQKCGDATLPLGAFAAPSLPDTITTSVDGRPVHEWRLDRLFRPVGTLIADLSAFMTLKAGDVLLIGLPGDAPKVGIGQSVTVEAAGFLPLSIRIEEERA